MSGSYAPAMAITAVFVTLAVYLVLDSPVSSSKPQGPETIPAGIPSQQPAWNEASIGARLSPFGALSCDSPGGLLSASTACSAAQEPSADNEALSPLATLQNALAALSANHVEPIYEINRTLADCTSPAPASAGAPDQVAKRCDVAAMREVVRDVEAMLTGIQGTPKGREAMLSWLVHWEHLEHKAGDQGQKALEPYIAQLDTAGGKQLRQRLRDYLGKLEPRDEYEQSVLDRLNDEDQLRLAPVGAEVGES